MYVTCNLLKFHSILGKATFLSLSTSSSKKSQECFEVEVFIVFFFFKTFSLFAFACHLECIFWWKHLLLKICTFKCECWCNMNSLSCPTGSNYKHGRLREGYINGQLDTRWEQIKWLNDITYTQYKQLDNGENRRWLGNGQGKLELAG